MRGWDELDGRSRTFEGLVGRYGAKREVGLVAWIVDIMCRDVVVEDDKNIPGNGRHKQVGMIKDETRKHCER